MKFLFELGIIHQLVLYGQCSICNESHTKSSGIVGIENYKKGTDCTYTIKTANKLLRLSWTYFNVEGKMPYCYDNDRVEIYNGCHKKHKLATFCSSNMVDLPHDIYTNDGCLTIQLHTTFNRKESSYGFRANYESGSSVNRNSECPSERTVRFGSGIISSPRWPLPYQRKDFKFLQRECEWDIEISNRGKLIQLNFMDVDFDDDVCKDTPHVSYKGESSVLTNDYQKRKYCEKNSNPFSVNTEYYSLEIQLSRSHQADYNQRGFILGWVSYTDDKATQSRQWGMIAGAIVAVGIVILIIFCVYRRIKRRRDARNSSGDIRYAATTDATTASQQQVLLDRNTTQHHPPPQQCYLPPTQSYPQPVTQPCPPTPHQAYTPQPYSPAPQKPYTPPTQQPYPPPTQQPYPPPTQQPYTPTSFQVPPPYSGPGNPSYQ